jgi:hypothetical protein
LARKLAECQPHEVQQVDIVGIKDAMKATPNVANRGLSLLRQVFDYAVEHKVPGVTSNSAIGGTRHAEAKRDRLVSADEFARTYVHADTRLQVIVDLAIHTGQRVGAILRLRRDQLVEEGIRVCRHKTDLKGIVMLDIGVPGRDRSGARPAGRGTLDDLGDRGHQPPCRPLEGAARAGRLRNGETAVGHGAQSRRRPQRPPA